MAASHGNLRTRLLAWLYRATQRVMTCDITRLLVLDRDEMREIAIDRAARYRFLSPGDVETFAVDPANELTSEFAWRLAEGRDRCYAALVQDKLAAYIWLAAGSIEAEHNRGRTVASGVSISFPTEAVFVYKAFTRPEYRGRRLYAALLAGAMRELYADGVQRMITTADWTNEAAAAACRRLGFREIGKIYRYACGGCAMTIKPPEAREQGIRIGRRALVEERRLIRSGPSYDQAERVDEVTLTAV